MVVVETAPPTPPRPARPPPITEFPCYRPHQDAALHGLLSTRHSVYKNIYHMRVSVSGSLYDTKCHRTVTKILSVRKHDSY